MRERPGPEGVILPTRYGGTELMASFLVTYGSGTGQTAKVAERIGAVLAERGHAVTVRRVDGRWADVESFDAVLVGSPVTNRRHLPEVVAFVEANRRALSDRPSAFFQLSLASAMRFRRARDGAVDFVDDLVERTGWEPDRVGVFAGSIAYTQYDLPTRLAFRLVAAVTTGDTDTSRDYEYTDWAGVETFATDVAHFVEERVDEGAASGADEDAPDAEGDDGTTAGRLGRVARAGFVVALAVVVWLVLRNRVG